MLPLRAWEEFSMIELTVNVDHVATVREARMGSEPDPVTIALMAETAGAGGVALHLRSDRKHVQERDLRLLRELAKTSFELQIGPAEESVGLALASRPDVATLVQESEGSGSTSLDLVPLEDGLRETVQMLKRADVGVSFFVEPDLGQVKTASRLGAHRVELRAHKFASSFNSPEEEPELEKIAAAASMGAKLGMAVYAGGSIDYKNVQRLAQIEELSGLVLGHAVVSRALAVGVEKAVGEMLALIRSARAV
jgi:pyridoxine 5-phosphate synthase